ncbi:hypothetical protein FF38_14068 [Lucilia cuprina]|uniref:ANKLE2 third alpha/beta domain-containing protein n=1 Tax=Lucilia cuprina TaxID=7375 RepID=A0A0L0C4M1_LUCCU|nr:Ankyrin repeat and LEM domain-containing protein 2 [Lucilia cuprina]KNC27235.1 hypothetical protein FF38_14068 [Lucilia cuprina]
MPYYGLYIPVKGGATAASSSSTNGANSTNSTASLAVDCGNEVNKDNNETDVSAFVFQNKKEALQVLKQHKDARFKEFLNEDDAIKYAQTGYEFVQNKYNDVKTSTESLEKAAFRAPTKQQLIKFRQIIEVDDWELVKKMIWDNPRYLVSSGDTPTILKESFRYNAMHVCAISKCPNVAKLILDTVSDPKFADLLMGKKNDEKACKELCANLLDYYLNIPEKGRSETPLHLASKFGCPEMVEVLTSYPECKNLPNDQGLMPKNIICDRGNENFRGKIEKLFEERYYVPVLRCNDSAIPAQIGEPFAANNPPNLNCDNLTPEVEIKALAGPMSKEQAKQFFRRWKTPPRLGSNMSSPIANNPYISPMKPRNSTPIKTPRGGNTSFNSPTANLQRRSLFNSTPQRKEYNGVIESNGFDKSLLDDSYDDKQNGNHEKENNEVDALERTEETNNNNHLSKMPKPQMNMLKSALCPRTPLFKLKNNAFSNYREQNMGSPLVHTIEFVQEMNDSLLNVSDVYDSPGFKERHVKNSDPEKGIECIGRVLAKEQNIEWREYWDFLEEFIDIASDKGVQKLENYLAQRQREQDQRNNRTQSTQKSDILDDVRNALENCFISSNSTAANNTNKTNTSTHQSTTPYTYVEKSLQVHARRMTKTIIHNINNEVSIIDALLLELRRVKSLIYSFKEDASYINVNFEKVHSRIGNLVSMFLENSQEVTQQMKEKILIILQNLSTAQGERREHMECVCSRIFYMLQHPTEQVLPENVKTEDMCSKIWSQEKDCDCQWESNLSRKTSRRNRMEARYKNHQRLKQQEKVQKDADNQLNDLKGDWRNTTAVSNDTSDEEEFWSDFGGSDTEEDEVYVTPCESPSRLSLSDDTDDECNKIFIYGNEPTKRDLDVLNAIFHITIDKTKFPNIHSWKSTIMRYPNEEKDYFPSPRIVKKSHSFVATSANKKDYYVQPQTPTSMQRSYSIVRSNTSSLILHSPRQQQSPLATSAVSLSTSTGGGGGGGILKEPILQLPTAKRLFMSPGRPKTMTAISLANNTNTNVTTASATTTTTATTTATAKNPINVVSMKLPIQQHMQKPVTPLNKLRGLFSAYRECLDSSPLSTSSTSP